jgi:hypothetical protein
MTTAFDNFIDRIFDHVEINGCVIPPSEVLLKTRKEYYNHLMQLWFASISDLQEEIECQPKPRPKTKAKKKS